MEKFKSGLHKKVSAIFDGMPIRQDNGNLPQAHTSAPAFIKEQHDEVCVKPAILSPVPPPPPAPSHQQSPLPANVPLTKRSRPDNIAKPSKQIPWQQIWKKISGKLFADKSGADANRQKVMVVLIPVLFIILIIVLTQVLSGPASSKATAAQNISVAGAATVSNDKVNWQIPAQYPANMRDPMQKGSGSPTQGGELAVKGILYSQDKSSAIIGSLIVHEGEKVSGATVLNINKDSVDFEMDGKKWTQQIQK
jgi:hypothetical protein